MPPAKFVHNAGDRRGMAWNRPSGRLQISGGESFTAVQQLPGPSYAKVEWSVLLPQVEVGRHAR